MAAKYDPMASAVIRDAVEALVAEGHPRDKLLAAVATMRDVPEHVIARLPEWVRKYRERRWGRGGLPYFQALHRALVSERAATASVTDTSWYDEAFWFWELGLPEANFMVRKEGCTEIDLWRYLLLEKAKEQHNRKVRDWEKKRAEEAPIAHELRLVNRRILNTVKRIAKNKAKLEELHKQNADLYGALYGAIEETQLRIATAEALLAKQMARRDELKALKVAEDEARKASRKGRRRVPATAAEGAAEKAT